MPAVLATSSNAPAGHAPTKPALWPVIVKGGIRACPAHPGSGQLAAASFTEGFCHHVLDSIADMAATKLAPSYATYILGHSASHATQVPHTLRNRSASVGRSFTDTHVRAVCAVGALHQCLLSAETQTERNRVQATVRNLANLRSTPGPRPAGRRRGQQLGGHLNVYWHHQIAVLPIAEPASSCAHCARWACIAPAWNAATWRVSKRFKIRRRWTRAKQQENSR